MSFLEDLSDSFDDYSGLMMAGGMLQRQSMISAQKQNAASAQELVALQREQTEIQREQARLQQKQQKEAMSLMKKEQKRREQTERTTRECRYLITYTSQILSEAPECPLTLGTAGIVCQMVDTRMAEVDLAVEELQTHQRNQGLIRQATGGGSGINAAVSLLDQLSERLQTATNLMNRWISNREKLCQYFYNKQTHPLWVAYCIPKESQVGEWTPDGANRFEIAESIKLKYSTLAIPKEVSDTLMIRVDAVMERLLPKVEQVLQAEPDQQIESSFAASNGLLVLPDNGSRSSSGDELLVSEAAGHSALTLSRPPNIFWFKVAKPILLFLNLAEDVADGEVILEGNYRHSVTQSYHRFMKAMEECDQAFSRKSDCWLELLCLRDGELQKSIQASLTILKHRSENEQAEYEQTLQQVKIGNIRRAEDMIEYLRGQNNLEAAQTLTGAIAKVKAPLNQMQKLAPPVLEEYERLNTPLRRAWGPGFGKVYDELEARLRKLHAAVRQSPYPPNSELAAEVDKIIQSVTPACELAELCFTWKKPRVTLADLVAKLKPKATQPGSIYVNAMCAVAAADGDFCIEEQRLIEKRLEKSPIKLSPASIKNVIGFWCDKARAGSVQDMIAQSVVDTQNLRSQPGLSQALLKDMFAIAKADGKASHSEGIVYKAVESQLKAAS